MAAVVLVPLAHLDGIYRFALLPQVLVLQVVVLAGMGIWAWRGGAWRRSPLALPAVAFLLADLASMLVARNRVVSLLPIATHAALVFFFLTLLNGLSPSGFRKVLKGASATAALVAALGMAQYLGWARDWVPTAGLPSATLGHRNIAAAYLVAMLPFTFWAWADAKRRWPTVLWGAALGVQAAFLLATRSRGAWVGLGMAIVALGILAAVRHRGRVLDGIRRLATAPRIASLCLVAILVAVSLVVSADIEKGTGEAMWEGKRSIGTALSSVVKSGGDKGRLVLWHRTLEMIAVRPIMGIGAGNWRLDYPAYARGDLMDPRTAPHRPHNDFLWIWAEMGTVGLGLYLYLLWTAGRMGLRQLGGAGDRLLAGVLLCSLAAALGNSLFSFPREFPAAWMPFYLALTGIGLLGPVRPRVVGVRVLLWGGMALLLAGVWVSVKQIGFDRHALPLRVADAESRWRDVIREADLALAWGPFDEEAYLLRGRAFAALGAPRKALADYRKGLGYHPNSTGLWNELGNALRGTGDRPGAHRAYRRALAVNPKSGAAYNNIGTLFATTGALDSALAAYEQAVTCQPDLTDAYANLSILYRKRGDLKRSVDAASRALKQDPDHLEALNALGSAYLAAGRLDAAAGAFSRAVAADSTRAKVYYWLGQTHERRKDHRAAAAAYEAFFRHWRGGNNPYVDAVRRRLEALKGGNGTPDG